MPRKLEIYEIQHLALRPNVRRTAVKNFLISMPLTLSAQEQLKNLAMDARLYKWDKATIDAIADGIYKAYERDLNRENEKRSK